MKRIAETIADLTGINQVVASALTYSVAIKTTDGFTLEASTDKDGGPIVDQVKALNDVLDKACEQHGLFLPFTRLGAVVNDSWHGDEYIITDFKWDGQGWQCRAFRTVLENVLFE